MTDAQHALIDNLYNEAKELYIELYDVAETEDDWDNLECLNEVLENLYKLWANN